ncbi:MAG: S9 family peptidase [Acidimicrobiia bacterium]
MQPPDLALLAVPSDPQIHPDGVRVAFVISRLDLEDDTYRRQIHVHHGEGESPFTAGPIDSMPRWAPDGQHLAFLRATDLKKPIAQVWVMPADGGEAREVTDFSLGVEYLVWSPDGKSLAVAAKAYTEDQEDLSEEERGRRPKRISRFPYRYDGRGWLHDRRRQVWIVDAAGDDQPRRLTEGDYDEMFPAWHPGSDRVAIVTDRHPRQGLEPGSDLVEVTLDGRLREAAPRGRWLAPLYRPDGTMFGIGGPEVDYPRLDHLWQLDGMEDVTAAIDRSIYSLTAALSPPVWRGDTVYSVVEDSGRVELCRFGGEIERIIDGERQVTGFDVSDSGRVVATVTDSTHPGKLVQVVDGAERVIAAFGGEIESKLVSPTHWRVTSEGVEIDVWAFVPEGAGRLPVLVNIHGGPATQYGFGFFDEFQVYAGAGYGVVACNPRGSSGRGLDFARAVREDGWGTVDVNDVTAALESALDRFPQLDPERVGIMGGSYGGFMTAWTTAKDKRYKSAVVERALTSFPSFNGTSDIAPQFGLNYLGTRELLPNWEKSPLAFVNDIRTPTLIIHSEEDYRCPVEQGEQLLLALWMNGVEAEMLRFPEEGHELSRSGKPKHRVERFEAILAWHDRYLR